MNGLTETLIGFAFNLIVVTIIIRFIYYPVQRDKTYVFTFFAFNTVLFFILNLLGRITFSIEVGFGLFAIFSILRYRTDSIPIREMTYLFVIIALPMVNAVLSAESAYVEMALANVLVIAVLYIVERQWGFAFEMRQTITYEKIELIKPENRALLLQDLEERTGLTINRVEIGRIDFLRDTAEVKIYSDAV